MARKERSTAEQRGLAELVGISLLILAVLLFLSLFSFDRRDLSDNVVPANEAVHNLIGRFGAWLAAKLFFLVGAGAYLLAALVLGFGVSSFVPALSYLRRSLRPAIGATMLLVSTVGLLDLFSRNLPGLAIHRESLGAGGLFGWALNRYLFEYLFNRTGATILYGLLYVVSMWFLTDLNLGVWIRDWIDARRIAKTEAEAATPEEAALQKRARDLERRARQLREQLAEPKPEPAEPKAETGTVVEPPNLGADLQPVPEPTVRDLSVPQPSRTTGVGPMAPDHVLSTGETIRASEVAAAVGHSTTPEDAPSGPKSGTAATTSELLGRESAARPDGQTGDEDSPAPDADAAAAQVPAPRPKPAPRKPKPITVASAPLIGNYQFPSLGLLNPPDLTVRPTETKEELMANARLMVQTLAQFGIEVAPGDITKGPTITRYELHPAPGVKLEKIAALTNNIAAVLKAERIHILAPVPGKSSVGVEVPNAIKTKVILRDLMESPEWHNSKARIPLLLGKDVYGHPILADLSEMPHLLIAGSTGSGKSVCINSIIASLLYKFRPDQLRFVMIDPKVVELQQYNSLPHLVVPVVTDPKKVVLALRWVVNEMEKRYQIFARVGVRNIKSFNDRPKDKLAPPPEPELPLTARKEKVEAGAEGFAVEVDEEIVVPRDEDIVIPEKLSYIVVIIDELADLMLVAPADVEMAIARITQMARAAGIHCIVATQRPSVDVITGVIKANIPARIAFQVAAKVDSRTILDQMGADKLLGKGDMLYLPPGSARLTRAQGVLITDQEIERIVEHIRKQGKPSYEIEIHQALQKAPSSVGTMSLDPADETDGDDEDLLQKCIEVIRSEKKASVSLLQRRLKLGYGRAARLMDELEDRGVVGPSKGAEPRDILIDLDHEGYDGGGQQLV